MRHEAFDIRSIDVQSLNPAQRDALKKHIIRRPHGARTQAIRHAFGCAVGLPSRLRPTVLVQAIRNAIGKVWIAHIHRRDRLEGLAQLRAMTDYELRDIGFSRSEIGTAISSDERDAASRNRQF